MTEVPTCAILDDYQDVALKSADWSSLAGRVALRRFSHPFGSEDEVAAALADCEIVVVMRERTPFPASLLSRLPKLRLLVTGGMRNRSIDLAAARQRNVIVCGTAGAGDPAAELCWAGILAFLRDIPREVANLRAGGPWQIGIGTSVGGKRLGVVGLGRLGSRMVRVGQAFDMQVSGWTRRDLEARADMLGIQPLLLPQLFEQSDIIVLQLSLTAETKGIIDLSLLERMKPGAILVNTARGPLVDEAALVRILSEGRIRGAVLDVFESEPLPPDHPFRRLPNVLATPHMGYVTQEAYHVYYTGAIEAINAWLDGAPIKVLV